MNFYGYKRTKKPINIYKQICIFIHINSNDDDDNAQNIIFYCVIFLYLSINFPRLISFSTLSQLVAQIFWKAAISVLCTRSNSSICSVNQSMETFSSSTTQTICNLLIPNATGTDFAEPHKRPSF